MSAFGLYCLLTLDGVLGLLRFLVVASVIAIFFLGVLTNAPSKETSKEGDKILKEAWCYLKVSIVVLIVSVLVTVALPTTKQAAVIWLVPQIANNERLHDLGGKGLQTLEALVDAWAQEAMPKERRE